MEKADCLLIIDEQKGRKLVRQLGLKITGTPGLITEAKLSGHIQSVVPLLDKIKQTNFGISKDIVDTIRKRAGE